MGAEQRSGRTAVQGTVDRLRHWVRTTLQGYFTVLGMSIVLLSLLHAYMSTAAVEEASNDLDQIVNKHVPIVDASQGMLQTVFDISTHAADYLMIAEPGAPEPCVIEALDRQVGTLSVHECIDRNIRAETMRFDIALYKAAHVPTSSTEEKAAEPAIENIAAAFQEYMSLIDRMRYEYRQAKVKSDRHDQHIQRAYQAYRGATDVLHSEPSLSTSTRGSTLLLAAGAPACTLDGKQVSAEDWLFGNMETVLRCLNNTTKEDLDAKYREVNNELHRSQSYVTVVALLLCSLLLVTAVRMAEVTHRRINVGLAIALLIGLGSSIAVLHKLNTLSAEGEGFARLVTHSYQSVYDAAHLKRYATAANADESRWLIATAFNDRAEAERWQTDWVAKTRKIRKDIEALKRNRRWPAEDEPLNTLEQGWKTYYVLDAQIRAIAKDRADPNGLVKAERVSTEGSDVVFEGFIAAADRLQKINDEVFQQTRKQAEANISGAQTISMVLFPLAGLVAIWGISLRWKDF